MKMNLLKGWYGITDLILPRSCLVCRCRLLKNEKHLCISCMMDIPLARFWNQPHNPMADKFNRIIQSRLEGSRTYEPYAYAAALFHFHNEAGYRHILYSIKYLGNISAGKYFGTMLGKKLAEHKIWSDIDLIIPVPLHWIRKWKRGYNQAEVIASAIAGCLHIPICPDLLRRRRRTRTQTKLSGEEKFKNVDGAFVLRTGSAEYLRKSSIRHIVIVDDLFTSGNTLFACFQALRSVFPPSVRISVATLGFVGGR